MKPYRYAAQMTGLLSITAFATTLLAADPIDVTTRSLEELAIPDSHQVSAEVISRNRAALSFEVSGRIATVHVDVGTEVKRNQRLIELDPTLFRLAVRRAKANLDSAKAELGQLNSRLERVKKLANNNYASADELEELQSQVSVLEQRQRQRQVDLDEASEKLSLTRLKAPFDGVVESRMAQQGSYATTGNPQIIVTEFSGREISVRVPASEVKGLHTAEWLEYTDDEGRYPVTLLRVSKVIDASSRQQVARLGFNGESAQIGSIGRLYWRSGQKLIPNNLVVMRDDNLGIFIADGTTARFHVLNDAVQGRPAPHSLPVETRIIVNGRFRLNDGDIIKISFE